MKKPLFLALIIAVSFSAWGGPAAGAQAKEAVDPVTIGLKTRHSAIVLAGDELAKYLGQMAGDPLAAVMVTEGKPKIELGLLTDFGVSVDGVEDPALDDAIHIDVRNSQGIVAGSNPRSVLFAAYRFLEESGCRWIRPGPDGDYVPSRPVHDLSVRLDDKAVHRFRGHNNCGTYGIDYILSKIEWGPKVGLNTFYNEFLIPRKNYVNWHSRRYPSARPPEHRTDTEIRAYHELLNREAKRRGILLHAAGHGWNARLFGNPEAECDHEGTIMVPEDEKIFLSLVEGERVMRGPTTTELCYGHPEVRRRLVQLVADYAQTHPEVDYLHFWIDDRMNNTCECERCRERRVADFYVMMLNAMDAELSRRGIPTRLVFLIYQDLLWPPETGRLDNPDRFVLMFAPISRLYDAPYEIPDSDPPLPPYRLNQNESPHGIAENVAFLRAWQRMFPGPGFVYDYHMVWYHYFDQGYVGMLDVLAEDIRRLPRLNLEGFVSCQNQKAFFPHGFPQHAHARLLWNPEIPVDDIAREFFESAFGPDGMLALEHMRALSDLFSPQFFYRKHRTKEAFGPEDPATGEAIRKLSLAPDAVREFRPAIERNLTLDDATRRLSWEHLSVHAGMVLHMAEALRARAEGAKEDETARWQALRAYLIEHEALIENVFDGHWFHKTFPAVR